MLSSWALEGPRTCLKQEWTNAAAEYKERMETNDPTVERFRGLNEHKGMTGTMVDPENPDSEGIAFLAKIVGD